MLHEIYMSIMYGYLFALDSIKEQYVHIPLYGHVLTLLVMFKEFLHIISSFYL